MAGKNLSFYNLTGGLNTVQDLFTLNSTPNRTETPDMVNVEYYKLGGLKSMDGNKQIGSQFLQDGVTDKITLGYEYQKGNEVYMVVTTFNGNCYMYDEKAKVFNKFYEFPSNTERHSITSYNGGIVITNGVDNLLYYALDRDKELTGGFSIKQQDGVATLEFKEDFPTAQIQVGEVLSFIDKGGSYHQYYVKIVSITPEETTKEGETVTVTPGKAIVKIAFSLEDVIDNFWRNTFPLVPVYVSPLSQTSYIEFKAQLVNTDEKNPIEPKDINGLAINSYKGRLWIGSDDGILYASELGLLTFDIKFGAVAYDNFFEDTSKITALGIWSQYLICHKHNGSYLVDANADDTQNWSVKPYSEISCESQQSFKSNDVGYFLFDKNNKGIYPLLSRSLYNTTYMGKELSIKINNLFQFLDFTKLDEIYISYHPQKQYLIFYMNFIDGNGYSNKAYIYNLLTKSWLYRELPQEVTAAFEFDNNVYIGTKDGYVLKEFVGASFNGEPINFSWTSPSYIWGGGTNKTTTKEFRVKLNNIDSNHFYIHSIRDGHREDKKSRLITNNKDNGTALIWDTGYHFGDMALKDIEMDVFHYKAQDGKDYYSLNNTLTSNNVPMYFDNNLTLFAGLNQDLYIEVAGTVANYNYITYTKQNGYKWIGKNNFLKCYRSTKDNRFKAWIAESDTSKAICNYKKVTTNEIEYLAFNAKRGTSDYVTFRVLKSDYDKYWNTEQYQMPAWVYYSQLGTRPAGWYRDLGAGPQWFAYIYAAWKNERHLWYGTGSTRTTYQIKERQPTFDGYKEVNTTEWNGKDTPEDGIEVKVDRYGLDSIVIQGEVFTRYPDGDYGQNNSYPVYTLDDLSVGQPIYKDVDRKQQLSTIKQYVRDNSTGGGSYIVAADDKEYFYDSTIEFQIPNYILKKQLDFTFEDMVKGQVQYPYPTEEGRSLTDTEWDSNTWVTDGYLTKRFLLSNQYFETIQYKFSGSTLNDSMNISGFEVDGIQINEVPW